MAKYVTFHQLKIGHWYGKVNGCSKEISSYTFLGRFARVQTYGRTYYPYIDFFFVDTSGNEMNENCYPLQFGEPYFLEVEEPNIVSKKRTISRTLIMKDEITTNHYAFSPENVVATQGIDISGFQKKNT